jgi:hypothetical protein
MTIAGCTELYFGTECGMSRKMIWLCAVLAAIAMVPTGPTARAQSGSAPNADPCTKEVCEDGFTKQLNDEQKKVFMACVAQKKCASAVKSQNPLISPFPH